MMKKFTCVSKGISRQELANPYSPGSLRGRLIEEKAIIIKDNRFIEDLGHGYCRIHPINKEIVFK